MSKFPLPPILTALVLLLIAGMGVFLLGRHPSLAPPVLPTPLPIPTVGMVAPLETPLPIPVPTLGMVAPPPLPASVAEPVQPVPISTAAATGDQSPLQIQTPTHHIFSDDEKAYLKKVEIWSGSLVSATQSVVASDPIGSAQRLQDCVENIWQDDLSTPVPDVYRSADSHLVDGLSRARLGLRAELMLGGDTNRDTQAGITMINNSFKETSQITRSLLGSQ